MNQLERNKSVLLKYIPETAVDIIAGWIYSFDFKLKIKKARASKYGDYMPPVKGKNHQITINHDLNKYAFLITLIHEIAHLSAWKKFGNNIASHGKEWKQEYRVLLHPFLNETVFPADIIASLKAYMIDPAASVCNDTKLFRVLNKYNTTQTDLHLLEDLPLMSVFETTGNEKFIKQKKYRTRYLCTKISTKEEYLFHGLAQVKPVKESLN
ncbi:MAG TPA: SprT-like domain-containing protein [Bacteroidia bacterium]|jgi:SprT protein|nr:SprT-like domain-containing protein [Bacteroidia bacterium]